MAWNLELYQDLLEDYWDKDIIEWMRFGWPISRLPTLPDPIPVTFNHSGAEDFAEHVDVYHLSILRKSKILPKEES